MNPLDLEFEGKHLSEHFAATMPSPDDGYLFGGPGNLAVFRRIGPAAVPFLLEILNSGSLQSRWYAVWALAGLPEHGEAIAQGLLPLLGHQHPVFRAHVHWLLNDLRASSLPVLLQAFNARPELRRHIANALAYFGPSALEAVPLLKKSLESIGPQESEPLEQALLAIAGPFDADPQEPIPYLGEHVRLYSDDMFDEPRRTWEIRLLTDMINFLWDMTGDAMLADFWDPNEFEDPETAHSFMELLESWRPNQTVFPQPKIVIAVYGDQATQQSEIWSDDGRAFTMSELLLKSLRLQQALARCNDRIFEGLIRLESGAYYVNTGS